MSGPISPTLLSQNCVENSDRRWRTLNYANKARTTSALEGPFDLVILNSVAQYFPGVDYLRGVCGPHHEGGRRGTNLYWGFAPP